MGGKYAMITLKQMGLYNSGNQNVVYNGEDVRWQNAKRASLGIFDQDGFLYGVFFLQPGSAMILPAVPQAGDYMKPAGRNIHWLLTSTSDGRAPTDIQDVALYEYKPALRALADGVLDKRWLQNPKEPWRGMVQELLIGKMSKPALAAALANVTQWSAKNAR